MRALSEERESDMGLFRDRRAREVIASEEVEEVAEKRRVWRDDLGKCDNIAFSVRENPISRILSASSRTTNFFSTNKRGELERTYPTSEGYRNQIQPPGPNVAITFQESRSTHSSSQHVYSPLQTSSLQ